MIISMRLHWYCLSLLWLLVAPYGLSLTRIDFWHSMSGKNGEILRRLIDQFNRNVGQQQNVYVKEQFIGNYIEGLNKLRTSMLGGIGPHIVQVYEIGTQMMLDSNAIVPLYKFSDSDQSFDVKQFLPQVLRYYTIHNKIYSLPFSVSNPIVYYNADWLQKAGLKDPPKYYEDLFEICPRLIDKALKKTCITWPLHSWFFEQALAVHGVTLVNYRNGRNKHATISHVNNAVGAEFLAIWKMLVEQQWFADVGRGWDPAMHNFLAERSAMLVTSTSDVFYFLRTAKFKVLTAPLLRLRKFTRKKSGVVIGGNALWIMNGKPLLEQKAAYQFLKYMVSKDAQQEWHTNTGYFPIRPDVIEDLKQTDFYKTYPQAYTAIVQLLEQPDVAATNGALISVFPQVREYIESAIEQVLTGSADANEALSLAKTRSDKAMQRYYRFFEQLRR